MDHICGRAPVITQNHETAPVCFSSEPNPDFILSDNFRSGKKLALI
jgi:hypothetical protein